MRKRIVISLITLITLTLFVFGIFQIQQHMQLQEAISLEQERVNDISRAVFALGGESTIWVDDDGFPHIEYTLETNSAIINLAGLEIEHGFTTAQVMTLLAERDGRCPDYYIVHMFVWSPLHGGSANYVSSLQLLLNENIETFHMQFPNYEIPSFVQGLPLPILRELIRLEAEQRKVQ